MEDVSEGGARLTVEGSVEGLLLRESKRVRREGINLIGADASKRDRHRWHRVVMRGAGCYAMEPFPLISAGIKGADSFGNPEVADTLWNHIPSARGSDENGMETMKVHVLERALTAACIIAAIAVVWWGFKIMAA